MNKSPFASGADDLEALPDEITDTDDHFEVTAFDADDDSEQDDDVEESQSSTLVPGASRSIQITERDVTILKFLTRFQYAYAYTIARLLGSSENAIVKRLRLLAAAGLLKKQPLVRGAILWMPTRDGISIAGQTFQAQTTVAFATVQHTVGLTNLAAEIESEILTNDRKDVLGIEGWGEVFPPQNRFKGGLNLYKENDESEEMTFGEMTISEREIRQGQKSWRGDRTSADMWKLVNDAAKDPSAPELDDGNSGLFVVYGDGGKTGEHVPDLVVTRPRGADGEPNHIAIELEFTPKSSDDWKRILRAYRDAGAMYSKIIYFTHKKSIADAIQKVNADSSIGLEDKLVFRRYNPRDAHQLFLG